MPLKPKPKEVFYKGLWGENPVIRQTLGICSTLAVTNMLSNTLVMCIGLIFVSAFSNLTVSFLRNKTPDRVRMMFQVLVISSYVIIVDIFLKAFMPDMSEKLSAYVGLIITNCIIMGRCEAFARQNTPGISFLDGVASGLGYSFVLILVAVIREVMGMGSILGYKVLGDWWTNWTIMVMPPAAFFVLAIIIWVSRNIIYATEEKGNK